ncbi:MAG: NAD(P)/FAD-dependent oxidoreductase [Acidimicrobiales bacterium]
MRVAIVGGGPVGLFCSIALARRGREVVVIERDPAPSADGSWDRRGVMQFRIAHLLRHIVRQSLYAEMPDVWHAMVAAGGVPAKPDGFPDEMAGLQSRRSTFERAWWSVALRQPGLTVVHGTAESIRTGSDRVAGVVVDGEVIDAEIVIVASGRTTHLGDEYRAPGEGGACGFSYAARMYRARDGVDCPTSPIPIGVLHDGYQTIVFPQDDRTLSTVFVRPTDDARFSNLRHEGAFQAAARAIPNLAPWTDPDRFDPILPVLAGSGLSNTYRSTLDENGDVPLAGLFFVGDAVSTTNPAAGRGVSLGLRQASELLRLLDEVGTDYGSAASAFDSWCTEHIRPWFEDHVYWDRTLLDRLRGNVIDIEARLSSDVICAAAQHDPSLMGVVGPFLGMLVPPTALRSVEDEVRGMLRSGWRPAYGDGPSAAELETVMVPAAVR